MINIDKIEDDMFKIKYNINNRLREKENQENFEKETPAPTPNYAQD